MIVLTHRHDPVLTLVWSSKPLFDGFDLRNSSTLAKRRVRDKRSICLVTYHGSAFSRLVLVLRKVLLQDSIIRISECFDLEEFNSDANIVNRGVAQPGEGLQTFFFAALIHKVTR